MTPEQIIRRYQQVYGRIRADVERQIRLLWRQHGGLSDAQADAFVAAAVPVVAGAQTATAHLVAAYVAALRRQVLGSAEQSTVDVTGLRGVEPEQVYRRPVVTARTAVADVGFDEAMGQAEQRAGVLASTDVALAQRAAMLQAVGSDERVVGYRRVLTGDSCAYCATASTQRYRRGSLAPLHPHCDCSWTEIYGTVDPGRIINQQRLDEIKARAGDNPEYWKAKHFTVDADDRLTLPRVAVREHGELGPVLVAADHDFTGPDDLAA